MADDLDASYQVLGLKPGATPEQVKRAYRDLVKAWHPDRFPHDALLKAQAHTRTARLNAAYARVQEHLRNPPADAKPAHPANKPQAASPRPRPKPMRPPLRHQPGPERELALASKLLGTAGAGVCGFLVILAVATGLGRSGHSGQVVTMGLSVTLLVVECAASLMAGFALLSFPRNAPYRDRDRARHGLTLGLASMAVAGAILICCS